MNASLFVLTHGPTNGQAHDITRPSTANHDGKAAAASRKGI
jgi:hypothetical protein